MTMTRPLTRSYARAGTRELSLDVFSPAGEPARAAVLLLHGGAWRFGDRTAVHARAAALAQHGFTCLAVEYRLLGEAPWPAALEDVQAAAGWTAGHAGELDVDPGRIVLQGYSAGAHLALLAAAGPGTAGSVAAVVAFYPTIGLHAEPPPAAPPAGGFSAGQAADGTVASHLLLGDDLDADRIRLASPIDRAGPGFPPTLIIHGGSDRLIGSFSSEILYRRLRELGVPADLHIYAGQNHEFDNATAFLTATISESALFIRRMVTDAEAIRAESRAMTPFPPD